MPLVKEIEKEMKVIVDNKIPYIREVMPHLADEVVYLPGEAFTPEAVKDAEALIIRTRTHCNRQLLEGSRVRFIGTATIGFDHIDTNYCRSAGIAWSNCPGCNAGAVEQYVHASLLLLEQEKQIRLSDTCLGIIGVGHGGSRIAAMAQRLGMRVLLNDPPRADRGEKGFVSLQTLEQECDLLTFHTPLDKEGKYATYHLADHSFFTGLCRKPYIINTSRGEVIDTRTLLEALDSGQVNGAIIDVWENEPDINRELLDKVFIGTPHIAGYSADGKANATRMVLEAFCHFFNKPADFHIQPAGTPMLALSDDENTRILQLYDPRRDCAALRAHPEQFEQLRGNYPLRRE